MNDAKIPKLRFPGFEGEWEEKKLGEIIKTITPPAKIILKDYMRKGKYPIIDQSKDFINGWYDDNSAVLNSEIPLLVFGDHTCALKYINFPFVQGADGIKILKINNQYNTKFVYYSILSNPLQSQEYKRHFLEFKEKRFFYTQNTQEQEKIANFLSSVDEEIEMAEKKLEGLKEHKKGLMEKLFPRNGETVPQYRFSGFEGNWEEKKLGEIIHTITPPEKISVSNYKKNGIYPIVDQSTNFISGWVNDDKAVISSSTPLLVFGDHTCILKYIDFPFAQGADGIKILNVNINYNPQFIYQSILSNPIQSLEYKRHFSELKEKKVQYPSNIKEQEKIAQCLNSIDEQIVLQEELVEGLKEHKKGLMQQLFPQN